MYELWETENEEKLFRATETCFLEDTKQATNYNQIQHVCCSFIGGEWLELASCCRMWCKRNKILQDVMGMTHFPVSIPYVL